MSRQRKLGNGTVSTTADTLESDRIVIRPTNGEASKGPDTTVVTPVLIALAPVGHMLTCPDYISESIARLYPSSSGVVVRMSLLSYLEGPSNPPPQKCLGL
jgi:hypothetical protein